MRRTNHDVTADVAKLEFAIRRKFDAQLLVNPGEPQRLRLQHHRQAGGRERTKHFLTLPQAVA